MVDIFIKKYEIGFDTFEIRKFKLIIIILIELKMIVYKFLIILNNIANYNVSRETLI